MKKAIAIFVAIVVLLAAALAAAAPSWQRRLCGEARGASRGAGRGGGSLRGWFAPPFGGARRAPSEGSERERGTNPAKPQGLERRTRRGSRFEQRTLTISVRGWSTEREGERIVYEEKPRRVSRKFEVGLAGVGGEQGRGALDGEEAQAAEAPSPASDAVPSGRSTESLPRALIRKLYISVHRLANANSPRIGSRNRRTPYDSIKTENRAPYKSARTRDGLERTVIPGVGGGGYPFFFFAVKEYFSGSLTTMVLIIFYFCLFRFEDDFIDFFFLISFIFDFSGLKKLK